MTDLADLPDDIDALKAIIVAMDNRNQRLEKLVEALRHAIFGRKSEKTDPDQYELALEDIETGIAAIEAEKETCDVTPVASRKTPRNVNRGSLPKHLPRVEFTIEPAKTACACGAERHVIGEDVSERLDVIPAQFRVIVTRRPKYACRACTDGVVQASAPARLITGGLPTEATVAHVLVSKYADHLPLYRQAQIYSRQGIDLDRGTLGNWVGRACFHLMPIINHMKAHLRGADRIFVDETRAPVLDPGRKATKSGYFWAVVSDDRGHGGVGPPIVLFHYAPGRGKEHPLKFLAGYQGRFLQCDAYQSYNALTEITRDTGPWRLVHFWTHVRRRFVKRFENEGSPIAEEMLRQIALLYQIEKTVRGKDAAKGLGFSPHGAGRNYSRSEDARRNVYKTVTERVRKETKGIDVRFWAGRPDAGELPSAYKNAETVVRQIRSFGLAEVVDHVDPIGCIMAGDWKSDFHRRRIEAKRARRKERRKP